MQDQPPEAKQPEDPPFHSQDLDLALAAVQGTQRGLTGAEAAARLARHGSNRLPEPKGRGPLRRLLAQFNSLLIQVLLVAAVVTAALGHYVDTAVIASVAVFNALIGFVQEGRAEQALRAIQSIMAPRSCATGSGWGSRRPRSFRAMSFFLKRATGCRPTSG